MIPAIITTERLLLDQPTAHDVEQMTAYCQDPIFKHFLPLPWPYRREHAEYYIHDLVPNSWDKGTEVNWVIRGKDRPEELLGVVGVRKEHGAVGYWLGSEHRGHGYLPEALKAAIDWVIEHDFLAAKDITWACYEGNTASAQVARKTGFEFLGTRPSPIPSGDGGSPVEWHGKYRDHRGTSHLASWPMFTLG